MTEFQKFCYAVEVYRLVENYVNMRVKELHTNILWFLILQFDVTGTGLEVYSFTW